MWSVFIQYVTCGSAVWTKLLTVDNCLVSDSSSVGVSEVRVTTLLTYFFKKVVKVQKNQGRVPAEFMGHILSWVFLKRKQNVDGVLGSRGYCTSTVD